LAVCCPIIPFLEEILCKELIIESPKVLQTKLEVVCVGCQQIHVFERAQLYSPILI
jgi:hypothetical protein